MDRERLKLRHDGPMPFHAGERDASRQRLPAFGQKETGWIRHAAKAVLFHHEKTGIRRRAKTILHRPKYAELETPISFEIQHRIHHVLQNAGPCDISVLRHMPDDEDRDPLLFGKPHQERRTIANLRGAPHRRRTLLHVHRLNGIHDEKRGMKTPGLLNHHIEIRAGEHEATVSVNPETLRAHFNLQLRLLAARIENRFSQLADRAANLEDER